MRQERGAAVVNEKELPPVAVSAAEAARLLGVSRPTVYSYMRRPGFPAVRIGGRRLVLVDGLRRWLEQQSGAGEWSDTF